MTAAKDLVGLNRRGLSDVLEAGYPVDPAALDDTEYRGVSLGLPDWALRLTWRTFKKVFHRDPHTGHLRGWNVRMRQTGRIDDAYEPMMRHGAPRAFGHYRVVEADGYRIPKACRAGLMIDYGQGGNRWFDPMARLRDPIVAVDAGSVELLLGWSYVDVGLFTWGTPSFFSLERDGPLQHRADPPGVPRLR